MKTKTYLLVGIFAVAIAILIVSYTNQTDNSNSGIIQVEKEAGKVEVPTQNLQNISDLSDEEQLLVVSNAIVEVVPNLMFFLMIIPVFLIIIPIIRQFGQFGDI